MRISTSPVLSRQQFDISARNQRGPVAFSLLNSSKKIVSAATLLSKPVGESSPFVDVPSRPEPRQNSVADSSLTATKQTTSRDTAPVTTPLTGNVGVDAIALLSADLLKRGIDPASLGFSYSEQLVGYPGGSYMNRLITARVNGQTENYNAELVMKNPQVASVEILRLMPGYKST